MKEYVPSKNVFVIALKKILRPIILVLTVITLPLWWFPFHWYMNPSKKDMAEYEVYRQKMEAERYKLWAEANPEQAAQANMFDKD